MKEDVIGLVAQSVSAFGCLPKGWWFESTQERSGCFFVSILVVCLFRLDFAVTFLSKVVMEV